MKREIFLFGLVAIFLAMSCPGAFAQSPESVMETTYFSDGTLKTATRNTHYAAIEGSPYFYDRWTEGEATLIDGKTYKGLYLKYNEVSGTLMFKYDLKDSAMVFQFQPLDFKFNYIDDVPFVVHFLNGIPSTDGGDSRTFYQVLTDGRTKLLKRAIKNVSESRPYTNETIKKITEVTHYYVVKDGRLVRMAADKNSVLAVLGDRAIKIKQYMADNNIDLKNENDLAHVFEYYDTL